MENKKQTAVEWLEEKRKWSVITNEHIEQSKAMMNEQIEAAYRAGYTDCSLDRFSDCEKYYTSTYGQ